MQLELPLIAIATPFQLNPAELDLSQSENPLSLQVTDIKTGKVTTHEVKLGYIAPPSTKTISGCSEDALKTSSHTSTTFLTPKGRVVVTKPFDIKEAASRGLVPTEILSQPIHVLSDQPTVIQTGSEHDKPSNLHSVKQTAFGETQRLTYLRKNRPARDLPVVLETPLIPAHKLTVEMIKKMLSDEQNLKPKQSLALESIRSAIKLMEARGLSNEELARTMTVCVLVSQMCHEAFQLGVAPESIFRNFSCMNSQSLCEMIPSDLHSASEGENSGIDTAAEEANVVGR